MSISLKGFGLAVAMLGFIVAPAQARPTMYSGSLVFHALGNDLTTGTTPPFATYTFLALPLGAFCNPALIEGTTCGSATLRQGAPLTGAGTASVTGSSPAGFTLPASQLKRTTSGVLPPYPGISYTATTATLANSTGGFGSGGGPGSFSFIPVRGIGGTAVSVIQGAKQFGGVMRLLGGMRALSVASSRTASFPQWPVMIAGGSYATGITVLGIYYYPSQMSLGTGLGYATAFPWTTGTVAVRAYGDSPSFFPTSITRRGYDNRTAMGGGTIQLVTPILMHWTGGEHQGLIGILRLQFVPEPSSWLMLASGVGLLSALFQLRRTRLGGHLPVGLGSAHGFVWEGTASPYKRRSKACGTRSR
jgi:hypothetical protein